MDFSTSLIFEKYDYSPTLECEKNSASKSRNNHLQEIKHTDSYT